MIVRSPRTKRAGARGTDGFGEGVGTVVAAGAGVVGSCTAGGVTGFGGDAIGVDGDGESSSDGGAVDAVGLFVAIGVWQPESLTNKTTAMARANSDSLGLIRVSSSPWLQP